MKRAKGEVISYKTKRKKKYAQEGGKEVSSYSI